MSLSPKRAEAVARKHRLFVEAYLSNGRNGMEAARAAGWNGTNGSLKVQASRLLDDPSIAALVKARAVKVAAAAEMNTESWAREVTAMAFFRPADLYDGDGNLIPIHKLPEHVQAAIGSVDITRGTRQTRGGAGAGATGASVGSTTLINFDGKVAALGMMAKHLGLFERDNAQRAENIRVVVELVG